MADQKTKTPLLDELEKGPWPSFVTEIKKTTDVSPMCDDLLGQLELSYEEKKGHWKHGGIVGVLGYGGGVIGRYSDVPEQFPEVAHFHTMRVNQPSGWFYTSDALRTLCGIWERHGSGLTNMHGSTGDLVFLGTKTDELEPAFKELTDAGFDLGGSGLLPAHAVLLPRPGALRMGLLRHHEALLRPDPGVSGRAASAAIPLQVQDQMRRLPQRLRGRRSALRSQHHRHLERRHPPGRRSHLQVRRRGSRHPEGRLRPLPHPLHELGRKEARNRQQRMRPLHALHQRDAQGPASGRGARRGAADRREGPNRARRSAVFGPGPVRAGSRAAGNS